MTTSSVPPWPVQALRVPATRVERPRFPVVNAHEHLGTPFGQDWHTRTHAELIATLDEVGIEMLVDLDGGQGDPLSRHLERWQAPAPDRVAVFAGLDYPMWATEPDFGALEAERLHDSVARGARGLKVWKLLGLRARDVSGRLVTVDDERLDPMWRAAAELRLPVVIHIADPVAFFDPIDERNERTEELALHPDWHFWPRQETPDGPGFPAFDELMAAFDRLLGKHPDVTFVGCHVGCASEDLGLVSQLLERHPNLCVDIAARIGELGRQPYAARSFILRWSDRVLFGTDEAVDPAVCRIYYRFLETFDESFDYSPAPVPPQGRWRIHGLGLPDDVLRRVYNENARRVLKLPGGAPSSGVAR